MLDNKIHIATVNLYFNIVVVLIVKYVNKQFYRIWEVKLYILIAAFSNMRNIRQSRNRTKHKLHNQTKGSYMNRLWMQFLNVKFYDNIFNYRPNIVFTNFLFSNIKLNVCLVINITNLIQTTIICILSTVDTITVKSITCLSNIIYS